MRTSLDKQHVINFIITIFSIFGKYFLYLVKKQYKPWDLSVNKHTSKYRLADDTISFYGKSKKLKLVYSEIVEVLD